MPTPRQILEKMLRTSQEMRRYFAGDQGEFDWITLSPSGTHVQIDDKGKIAKGPEGMKGKTEKEVFKKSEESPKYELTQENKSGTNGGMENTQSNAAKPMPSAGKSRDEVIAWQFAEEPSPKKDVVKVAHSKNKRSYVAEISSIDPKYGFSRDFKESNDIDWGSYDRRTKKGNWHVAYKLPDKGGVYEVLENGTSTMSVSYPVRQPSGKWLMQEIGTNNDELRGIFNMLDKNGLHGSRHILKAMREGVGLEKSLAVRVKAYIERHKNEDLRDNNPD